MPADTEGINRVIGTKTLSADRRTLDGVSIETTEATTRLVGLGTAVPPYRCAQTDIAAFMTRVAEAQPDCPPQFARYAQYLARTSAIDHRHTVIADYAKTDPQSFEFFPQNWALAPSPTTADRMAVYRKESVRLAEAAARAALRDAEVPAEAVTHIVLSTCTGFFAPGPDVVLMDRLGLSPSVQRSILGFMGCFAGLNGLRAADHIVRAEPDAVVLQVAVELCSLHFQTRADLKTLVSNLLFSDGAAAAVYRRSDGRERRAPRIAGTASSVAFDTRDEMGWVIGDHGFEMTLADSVPRHLRSEAPRFVRSLLGSSTARATLADVGGWAVHPGGKKILDGIHEALGLEPQALDASVGVLRDFGNMSSATVLFVLQRLFREHEPASRRPTVALSFGPGLTMEGAVLVP